MTIDTKSTSATTQQAIRYAMLDMGYVPLPVRNKAPVMGGWQKIDVDAGTIRSWDRKDYANCTGLRLTGQLIAIDIDVDDKKVRAAIQEVMESIVPALSDAPLRRGSGAKECYLVRLKEGDEKFPRWRSHVYVDPADEREKPTGHAVEIFSDKSSRHIGVYGAHSTADDGTVEVMYEWYEGASPLETRPEDLPVVSKDDLDRMVVATNELLATTGWERNLRATSGRGGIEDVYDLNDDTLFECIDGVTRGYADMAVYARSKDPRCSASFMGPDGVGRRSRCQIGVDHENRVMVYDHASYQTHRHVADRRDTPGELSAKLAKALLDLGVVDAETFETMVNDDPFADALAELVTTYAFCGPMKKFIRIDGGEGDMDVTSLAYVNRSRDHHFTTKKGTKKRLSPVDALADSGLMRTVTGRRYRPALPERFLTMDGGEYLNAYVAPNHDLPYDYADCIALWQDFMEHLLPREDEREWFLNWLSHIAQKPHIPGVAVLHISDDVVGTGRGTLCDMMRGVYGASNVGEQDMSIITGTSSQSSFNDWMTGKVFIEVAEVSPDDASGGIRTRMDRKTEDRLKQLIDPRPRAVTINKKFEPAYSEIVAASFFLATNRHDALSGLSLGDRRFVVLRGPETNLRDNAKLFGRVNARRSDVGFDPGFCAALWHWMMERDLSSFDMQRPVDFGGKVEMVAAEHSELDEYVDRMLAHFSADWAPMTLLLDRVMLALRAEQKDNAFGAELFVRREVARLLRKRWPHKAGRNPRVRVGAVPVSVLYRSAAAEARVNRLNTDEREEEMNRARNPVAAHGAAQAVRLVK